jgi:hypothetical protein
MNGLATLHLQQTGTVLLGLNMVEAGSDTTLHSDDLATKEVKELRRLRSLNLTELDGSVTKKVIKFDGLVSSGTLLVLGARLTEPEMDVETEVILSGDFVGVEDDVSVTRVELAVLGLRPDNNLEFFNAPDLGSDLLTSTVQASSALAALSLASLCSLEP